jgi:hypothetical protein
MSCKLLKRSKLIFRLTAHFPLLAGIKDRQDVAQLRGYRQEAFTRAMDAAQCLLSMTVHSQGVSHTLG